MIVGISFAEIVPNEFNFLCSAGFASSRHIRGVETNAGVLSSLADKFEKLTFATTDFDDALAT